MVVEQKYFTKYVTTIFNISVVYAFEFPQDGKLAVHLIKNRIISVQKTLLGDGILEFSQQQIDKQTTPWIVPSDYIIITYYINHILLSGYLRFSLLKLTTNLLNF